MRKITMKYNPYRLETMVLIDGVAPKQNSKLNFGERRLQEWIEEFPDILFKECNTREFDLTFQGTILDYEDVEAMVQEADKMGIHIKLTHIPAKEVQDKEIAIYELFNEIQSGPFEELKTPDIRKAFNMAKSSDFEVNVVATMSAGKSTLINALLRKKLMPAKQEACTATITEIKDNDSDYYIAKAYDSNGHLIQTHPELSLDIMERLNSNPEVSKIRVEGNIPFVTAEDVALVLIDTPGPNNSRNREHGIITRNMLSEYSKTLVLYILNATQLAVDDDYNLLSYVAESMKVGGKQSRDRFIFVVNKLDEFRKGEDSVRAALEKVRDYLRDIGIENPNIYPASALTALNIRTILAENDNDDDDDVYEAKGKVRKFNRNQDMYFEKMAPLTPSVRGQLDEKLAKVRANKDVKEEALIHCGIVPIEMAIQMYVRKYAKTAKIKSIVTTFSKALETANSFEKTKKEIIQNKDEQQEILKKIKIIKQRLASGENARRFKNEIDKLNYDNEIRKMTNNVIKEAQKKITAQLSSGKNKMSKKEAEQICKQFARFTNNLQEEVQVKLENEITKHVEKNARGLLEQYKKKLSGLTQEINIDQNVDIDPLKFMEGDIGHLTNIEGILEDSKITEKRLEVVETRREYKEVFGFRRWLNSTFGTNFDVDYDIVKKHDWVKYTYIDGTKLAQRFFAPVQEQLYENINSTVEYTKAQTQKIKAYFSNQFTKLDDTLNKKLEELEKCANESRDAERKLYESQEKLKWLENIQTKLDSILDV